MLQAPPNARYIVQFEEVHTDIKATTESAHEWLKFINTAHTGRNKSRPRLQWQMAEDLPTLGKGFWGWAASRPAAPKLRE